MTLAVIPVAGPVVGALAGLVGIAATSFGSSWAALKLTELNFHRRVCILKLLETARERQVLRQVGAVYQFRHAAIQDRLAESWAEMQQSRSARARPFP